MYCAHPRFANTFVIAAVNDVFPWSTCPIVPMFTCGFDRSNFSLDMIDPSTVRRLAARRLALAPRRLPRDARNDLFAHAARRLGVLLKMHAVSRPALRT